MMFKRYLPRSLFGRALMIVVLPVLLLQAVVSLNFIQRHFDGVSSQMAAGVARELNYAVQIVEGAETPEAAQRRLDELAVPLGMRFRLVEDTTIASDVLRRFYDITGGAVEETLKRDVRRPLALDLLSSTRFIEAEVQTARGVLRVGIDRRRMIASNPHQLLVVTGLASLGLIAVAVVFLRNQVRPIGELAAAADAFGKGWTLPFQPRGAEEVRRAGAAFIAMRNRIERHIDQRTRMLSGVSHDLRSPLTRMKLALAMMEPGPDVDELGRDVREMEHMIEAFLGFARGEGLEEAEACDPVDLLRDVVEDAARNGAAGRIALVVAEGAGPVMMRRGAIKRALGNLIQNALAFGREVRVGLTVNDRAVRFCVEDDGPGIPAPDREAAMRPFVRLDAARNQDAGGGVGLGLAIAADAAHAHGGALRLGESPDLGGLLAELRLPR